MLNLVRLATSKPWEILLAVASHVTALNHWEHLQDGQWLSSSLRMDNAKECRRQCQCTLHQQLVQPDLPDGQQVSPWKDWTWSGNQKQREETRGLVKLKIFIKVKSLAHVMKQPWQWSNTYFSSVLYNVKYAAWVLL